MIAVLLKHQGYRPIIAKSAEDALIGFRESGYDLVLTDIFMDGMGGIEGIRKMRALAPKMPIVAMSAGYRDMTPEMALKASKKIGADRALAKPIVPEDLVSTLGELFA